MSQCIAHGILRPQKQPFHEHRNRNPKPLLIHMKHCNIHQQNQKDNDDVKLKARNVLTVFLNLNDQLMCGDDYINVDQLRDKAKEFIANPSNDENKPEKHAKEVEFFGNVQITSKHVISLRCDRGSSYQAYLSVQNELVAAYNELRDELAQSKWNKNYNDLNEDQQKAIREIYPQKISEAEPMEVKRR